MLLSFHSQVLVLQAPSLQVVRQFVRTRARRRRESGPAWTAEHEKVCVCVFVCMLVCVLVCVCWCVCVWATCHTCLHTHTHTRTNTHTHTRSTPAHTYSTTRPRPTHNTQHTSTHTHTHLRKGLLTAIVALAGCYFEYGPADDRKVLWMKRGDIVGECVGSHVANLWYRGAYENPYIHAHSPTHARTRAHTHSL